MFGTAARTSLKKTDQKAALKYNKANASANDTTNRAEFFLRIDLYIYCKPEAPRLKQKTVNKKFRKTKRKSASSADFSLQQ